MPAAEALAAGILDEVADGDLTESASSLRGAWRRAKTIRRRATNAIASATPG